jgi:hypothetical protein
MGNFGQNSSMSVFNLNVAGFWYHTLAIESSCFSPQLAGVFLTHFLFGHHLGKLRYPAMQGSSVPLGDFKLFPLLPARGLWSCATTAAIRSSICHTCTACGFTSLPKEGYSYSGKQHKQDKNTREDIPGNYTSKVRSMITQTKKSSSFYCNFNITLTPEDGQIGRNM